MKFIINNLYRVIFAILLTTLVLPGSVFAQKTDGLTVKTYSPKFVGLDSVQLKGVVSGRLGTDSSNAYFEWGSTSETNKITSSRTVSILFNPSNFSTYVKKLDPDRYYFYRAVAEDIRGKTTGELVRFRLRDQTAEFLGTSGNIFNDDRNVWPQTPIAVNPPVVVTGDAKNVTRTSANLNGSVFPRGDYYTNGYFQWGKTTSLGNQTISRGLGSQISMEFSENLVDLSPDTTYFFRAVGQNQNGSSWGLVKSFYTGTQVVALPPTVPPVVSRPTPTPTPPPAIEEEPEVVDDQRALTLFSGGFFPDTLIGWLILVVLLLALVAFFIWIIAILTKMKEEQERKKEIKENNLLVDN